MLPTTTRAVGPSDATPTEILSVLGGIRKNPATLNVPYPATPQGGGGTVSFRAAGRIWHLRPGPAIATARGKLYVGMYEEIGTETVDYALPLALRSPTPYTRREDVQREWELLWRP